MAGIDKTYTDSYNEYKEFRDWSNDKSVVFNYGNKKLIKNVSDYIYCWNNEDFNGNELPIMNTPTWLDKYLYDNCPCKFVTDRLNGVYPEKHLENLKFGEIPCDFKQNRKIVIKKTNKSKFPIHNEVLYGNGMWWLQTNSDFKYCEELDAWVHRDSNFPYFSNTMHFKTVKSMIRRLRKMYLPKDLEFSLIGRYVGETYKVTIK